MTDVVPTGSVDVVKLAVPPLSVPVPNNVVPFINETASPFGGAPALEPTTAVNVTASPDVDGFGVDESVVVVAINVVLKRNGTFVVKVPLGVVTAT